MDLRRRVQDYRSTIILVALVLLSLVSLASDTKAIIVADGLRAAVSVLSYPFWKTFKGIERGVDYGTGLITSYDQTKRENAVLHNQIAALTLEMAKLNDLEAESKRLRDMMEFQRDESRFDLELVEVIGEFERKLQIDRGKRHGVRPFMCAMTNQGLVGIVDNDVQPYSAHVLTLHHNQCRVGAMIARNRVRGIVQGSDSDAGTLCTMRYIDINEDVRPGDLVVTVGGRIFPKGLPIGTVVAVHQSGSLRQEAEVKPTANPYGLDEVFLVRRAQLERDELVAPPSRDRASRAQPMPDLRSIQERYAP